MADSEKHPASRFAAPASIQTGKPLKELMNRKLVLLISQSLEIACPGFDAPRFRTRAVRGLKRLELKERAVNIARAMAEQLPANFDELAPLLVKSMGPPLAKTEGNGLAPFFYFPHTQLVAEFGVAKFASGMAANYELTQRFTAEFSIRPFLIQHRSQCLSLLMQWTRDANPHVRRLVSEGTRPRLPWAMRLPEFQTNPHLTLPLLQALKDDTEKYVRRSVANHLADIAKDQPEIAFDVCAAWLEELGSLQDELQAENRRWMVRHALRHPVKQGNRRACQLRDLARSTKSRTGDRRST